MICPRCPTSIVQRYTRKKNSTLGNSRATHFSVGADPQKWVDLIMIDRVRSAIYIYYIICTIYVRRKVKMKKRGCEIEKCTPNSYLQAWCDTIVIRSRLLRDVRRYTRKNIRQKRSSETAITGDHSKQDQILAVNIAICIGFCVHRRSSLMWSPVILVIEGRTAQ